LGTGGDGAMGDWRHAWLLMAALSWAVAAGCERPDAARPAEPPRSTVEAGPVRLSVQFDPAAPALADRAKLTVAIDAEPGVTVEKLQFGSQFGDFRVVDVQEELPRIENHREIAKWICTLEPIRPGRAAIWPVDVAFVDSRATGGDGKRRLLSSKPLAVEVATAVKVDPPSLAGLRPEASLVPLPFSRLAWLGYVAAILAAAGVGIYVIRRRRLRREAIAQRPLTPAEIAYRELWQIVNDQLADRDVKLFFVALTGVVRRFIEQTTSIRAPEQTTEEFLHEISVRQTFPPEENQRLADFLEAADLVKFAAHRPRREDVDASTDRAREFIDARVEAMAAAAASQRLSEPPEITAKEVA